MINYDRRFVEQLQKNTSEKKKQEKTAFKKTLFWIVLFASLAFLFGI